MNLAFCSSLTALTARSQAQFSLSTVQLWDGQSVESADEVQFASSYSETEYRIENDDGSITELVEMRFASAIGGAKWSYPFLQMYAQFEQPGNPGFYESFTTHVEFSKKRDFPANKGMQCYAGYAGLSTAATGRTASWNTLATSDKISSD